MSPYDESTSLLARARRVIPGASQTLSRGPHNWPEGAAPTFAEGGKGCRLYDVDGQAYVDWLCGLASVGLGYGHPSVATAVMNQAMQGASFSLPHRLEVELAERLVEVIPCAEMVRFVKSGSESCVAALRIARAATSRDVCISIGYHGWMPDFAMTLEDARGVPTSIRGLTIAALYNDLTVIEGVFRYSGDEIAAVIVEPTLLEPPAPGYLERLRALCTTHGSVLIFDEIVCGYRWALAGGQAYFGVIPDLATFGKAMANGMPLSCVVGRRELMEDHARVISGTYGGEALSLAAALATLEVYQKEDVIEHMWAMGTRLMDGFNACARVLGMPFEMTGYAVHPKIVVTVPDEDRTLMSLFLQETLARGVLFHHGGLNVMLAHDDEALTWTLDACDSAFRAMREGAVLRGERIREAFKR